MGLYAFQTTLTSPVCALADGGVWSEIPDGGFAFEAAFSRFRDAGRYFITIGGVPHDAMFVDGQRITAEYSAQRNFSACGCVTDGGTRPIVTMRETFSATIVSKSQSDAVEGCVESPPFDPDAGIVKPDTTAAGGFDAVRACGTLTEKISMEPQCNTECDCTLTYTITGDRK